jgi:hypothetical protein
MLVPDTHRVEHRSRPAEEGRDRSMRRLLTGDPVRPVRPVRPVHLGRPGRALRDGMMVRWVGSSGARQGERPASSDRPAGTPVGQAARSVGRPAKSAGRAATLAGEASTGVPMAGTPAGA